MPREYPTVLDLVGQTPLARLQRIVPDDAATVVAKLEYMNPGGSVKDRIGIKLIEEAERAGKLKPGGTIVEPTSGNTGVGLAIAAAIASPTPVLPDVGSTIVPPGFSFPSRSAASISLIPIRSLTEPPGLMYSSLATTVAASSGTMRWSRASGVWPTRSSTVGYSRAILQKRTSLKNLRASKDR